MLLFIYKTIITIFSKYLNYFYIFSLDFIKKHLEYISINNYLINLKNSKHFIYSLIYNLKLVELEILKFYIKINFYNNFIKLLKFSTSILILFIYKNNKNFYLYIYY